MAEYIEREAFIEDIKTEITNLRMNGLKGTPRPHGELYDFIDRINEQPTADVVPVVHGRWIFNMCSYGTPKCSICGWRMPYSEDSFLDARNYCPNCGAKMDLEE